MFLANYEFVGQKCKIYLLLKPLNYLSMVKQNLILDLARGDSSAPLLFKGRGRLLLSEEGKPIDGLNAE